MNRLRVRWDPRLRGVQALGVDSSEALLEPQVLRDPVPVLGERARVVSRSAERALIRFPLPATPDENGRMTAEAVRASATEGGAGSGWVLFERFEASPLRSLLHARMTAPRSASVGERSWNLLCHLRAFGVGTPEPLAVGASGNALVSRRSFLMTREPDGFEPLELWLRSARAGSKQRSLGLESVGNTLAKLFRARVFLPRLTPETVLIAVEDADRHGGTDAGDEADCVLGAIVRERESVATGRLEKRRLPSVLVTDVQGGVLRERLPEDELRAMLSALASPSVSSLEALRVACRALKRGGVTDPAARRRVLA